MSQQSDFPTPREAMKAYSEIREAITVLEQHFPEETTKIGNALAVFERFVPDCWGEE